MFDICIIGSGAGAGPIIYELSKAGYKVAVLEKGPFVKTKDFSKDEMTATRRDSFQPLLKEECHVVVKKNNDGEWRRQSTFESNRSFWNGSLVGGSTNFMSGYFHRLKPTDFRLLSEYGAIEGANIVDWPISYEDLEPYYEKTERLVGVSGKVVQHSFQEPRSTPDFPYPPLAENIFSSWLDKGAKKLDFEIFPTPRGILSLPKDDRKSCFYSNYCGSYGCSSDAKGSARVALINDAIKTGNCTIIPNAKVFHLETNGKGKIIKANYYDANNDKQFTEAKLFVVAAQAVETARLLLMSKNDDFPDGLANNSGQVGKNMVYSSGGVGSGQIYYDDLSKEDAEALDKEGVFINRAIQQWYEFEHPELGKIKGGTIDFLSEHANGITKAIKRKLRPHGNFFYGKALKKRLFDYFTKQRKLKFEIFVDWSPNNDCFVELDDKVFDKWGDPVAKIWTGHLEYDNKVAHFLADKCEKLFEELGMKHISTGIGNSPPTNLQAGGCRFGDDPNTSVLDKNCKAHEVENLYVTDGSFMPTGGSVTYTLSIYANSFRVADKIKADLDSNY